ncbi:MAG: pyridoxamine 5'-phosphate oxidase family protein [Novosphingobium sp.]|nr:pyridoxamine 5'-phosphate oxidase family protein [Novosphingobium sp.]
MNHEVQIEFWESFNKSPFIMVRLEGSTDHAEPMTAQLDKDAHHTVWFFTTRDNRIGKGGRAMGQVSTKGHDVFACISGNLVEETDKARWDKHWDNAAEAWFPNGREDPNVIMLRFEISDSEVWTADTSIVGKLKLLTGKPISPEEAGEHAVGAV